MTLVDPYDTTTGDEGLYLQVDFLILSTALRCLYTVNVLRLQKVIR